MIFWIISNNSDYNGNTDYGAGNFFNNNDLSPVWIIITIIFAIMSGILLFISYSMLINNKENWKFPMINAGVLAIVSIISLILGL